jgi:glycosyltransferase involved in cell wall biosynthesis
MILLSICIPTYNRLRYLKELMPQMLAAVKEAQAKTGAEIELLVSDNAATDGTPEYLATLSAPFLAHWRNDENIGGDRNFLLCIRKAHGKYVWLFGDDDVLAEGAVTRIASELQQEAPALLILDSRKGAGLRAYPSYSACLEAEMPVDRLFALKHTLITSNVFERERFDLALAERTTGGSYAHMCGMMDIFKKGKVIVVGGLMGMREHRPDFAHWPYPLCIKQGNYLLGVKRITGCKSLGSLAFRLYLNLPVETAARLLHPFFPSIGNP